MKFIADQDVYQITIDFLKELGMDIVRAREKGLAKAKDLEILSWAYKNKRILLTRDKDFGALVFSGQYKNAGVILLRIVPATVKVVHAELELFLSKHRDLDLYQCFCVIEAGSHRIRQLSQ